MSADTVAEPGVLSEGRIPRSTIRLAERLVFGLIIVRRRIKWGIRAF